MAQIDKPLGELLDKKEQLAIIAIFWRRSVSQHELDQYKPYLDYYRSEMKKLSFGNIRSSHQIRSMAIQNRIQLQVIVNLLSQNRTKTLIELRALIRPSFPGADDAAIDASIDLTIRVWLMLNVRRSQWQSQTPNIPTIQWNSENTSLVDFVARQYPSRIVSDYQPQDSLLEAQFTAAYLSNACGITFEWTSCVADHLRLKFTPRKACRIFHYKNCLVDHLEADGSALHDVTPPALLGPVHPKEALRETIWTLNLLFPPDDQATDIFLTEHGKCFHNDRRDYNERPYNLNEYHHWRERLYLLRREFNAEAGDFKEFLHKPKTFDKKFQYWGTVMFGFFLALVFGVISSVTAVISTHATLEALAMQKATPNCPCPCRCPTPINGTD